MEIIEPIQRPGVFRLTMTPETPREMLDAIGNATFERSGQIYVFSGDVQVPTAKRALWAGVLADRSGDQGRDFGGFGLSGLLGTDEGVGPHVATNTVYSNDTITNHLTSILPLNGITLGTVNETGLTTVSGTWTIELTARAFIDELVTAAGGEWRVNPDGTLDVATAANLYPQTPSVFVTEEPTTEVSGALRGVAGRLSDPGFNTAVVTSRTYGYGEGVGDTILTSVANSAGQVGFALDGGVLVAERHLDLPSSGQTELDALTQASVARFEDVAVRSRIETFSPYIRRDFAPGENLYAYVPRFDMAGNPLVIFAGQPTYPLKLRGHQLDWTASEGMGVYLRVHDGTESWLRLTDYVQYGTGAASWVVGSTDGPAGVVYEIGPDRFGTR